MIKGVLVQQVRLVDQEDRMNPLEGALFDVAVHGVEQTPGGRGGRETERGTELAIEVAATERGVVIVGEPKSGGRDAMAKRA